MRHQQRLPASPERRREELFTQRYAQLRAWALRLTNQDRESAEDLVQDAFIQFALGRTSLEEIENIDGYLRRMLRYMYLSKISRNAQKFFDQTLSISEYDSFRQTWRAIAPPDRMQAQEELCQICAYACSRKETSRAGSVLILRFFHDYYPTEIARVLCSSRHCVDQWQRLARSELKLYLTKPARLRFVNAKTKTQTKTALTKLSVVNCDLLGELRQMIFRSRQGECLLLEELHDIYQLGNSEALTTMKLGHLVSCPLCLDLANQILGLPLLAERCQPESYDPKAPPPDNNSGSTSGGGTNNLQTNYQRRLREVREHKPQELRIAVNGFALGSLKVSSDRSEFDFNLGEQEIDFVEVYSEQGVQLMFLSVSEAARSKSEQWARIDLSEGRSLEARLCFETGPTLHLSYQEPMLRVASAPTLLKIVESEAKIFSRSWYRAGLGGFLCALRSGIRATLARQRMTQESSPEDFLAGHLSIATRKPFWARPEFLTAVVSVLLVGAIVAFKIRTSPTHNAKSLLAQASVAEELINQISDQVTRRLITLEVRRPAEGLVAQQKIEIWQKSSQSTRRLYDESNRLIAGTWDTGNGPLTVYHHGAKLQTQPATERPDYLLINLENIWQLEISAKGFMTLIADTEEAHVEESPTSYILRYDKEAQIGASRLLKATLILSRSNLHAIEQTLLIERGGEVSEYRFVETSFEQLPQNAVKPNVFEVEPELVDESTRAEGRRMKSTIDSIQPSSFIHHPSAAASTELEVDVAYLLNQANENRNEQVTLSRTANGLLRVEGIVDSEQRKIELLRALAPVSKNPAVKIEVGTVTETMKHQAPASSGIATIREAEDTVNTIAAYYDLRNYFAKNDSIAPAQSEDRLDEMVRSFSSRTVNRAYRSLFHAIELRRLVDRFTNVDMRTVSPDARAKWLQMLREHAAAFERDCAVLRQTIEPIFFTGQSSNAAPEFKIASDADLARAIERLHKLALANNEAIREAFTISSQSSSTALKSPQLRRSLLGAEKLAAVIKRYQE
jgi:RNA polymerase sigma factor (sigma-70 family)